MQQTIIWSSVIGVILVMGILIFFAMRVQHSPAKTYAADQVPAEIDVSNYPQEMQTLYNVFTRRCSKCHTVARPINSDFTPEEWKKYVQKMMRKAGSGLTPKTADQITKFLIYDSQHRERKTQ
ncbi:hypothetical protein F4083_06355 [Candidatus Poribacteria bacterium]|nr:hypothetical protein [Candidatus Poribacteria bacterium]MYI93931.1 hypothetical protein [Candidatus Poribacteria bacterium]